MTSTSKPYGVFTPAGHYCYETDEPEGVAEVAGVDVASVEWDQEGWFVYRDAAGDIIGSAEQNNEPDGES